MVAARLANVAHGGDRSVKSPIGDLLGEAPRASVSQADARAAMWSLPTDRQWPEHWLHVAALFKETAAGLGAMVETHPHLTRALKAEGMI